MNKLLTFVLSFVLLPTLSSATAIQLITGDEINAEIIEQTRDYLTLHHEVLGNLTIDTDSIVTIEGKAIPSDTAAIVVNEDNGLLGFGFLPNWQRSLTLGLNGTEGNKQAIDFHTAFDVDFEDNTKRWGFAAHYNFSKKEGD